MTVNSDGTVSFALPRAEVGQGITTAIAMMIADEMELPLDQVNITLADARPELVFNQLTGGSNSMHSISTTRSGLRRRSREASWHRRRPRSSAAPLPKLTAQRRRGHGARRKVGLVRLARRAGGGLDDTQRGDCTAEARVAVQTLIGTPQPRIDAAARS